MILPSQWQISFRCTDTGSVTETGLSSLKFTQTWRMRRGRIFPRSTYWMDALIPKNHTSPLPTTSTSASVASSARTPYRTPPTYFQKHVPLGLVVAAAKGASSIPKNQCLEDLVKIGLYFCLRSCKYTKTNSHRRTTQLRLRNIQFRDGCGTITFDSPESLFLNTLVVTLFLDTQKNSVRGGSISTENTRLLLV